MNTDSFVTRHIGIREEDLPQMLKTIGVDSVDELMYQTIPQDIRLKEEPQLDAPLSEQEFLTHIHQLSRLNEVYKSYIGLGYLF